jgi:hypothetical protein
MEKSANLSQHKTQKSKQQAIADFEKAVDELDKFHAKEGIKAFLNVGQ